MLLGTRLGRGGGSVLRRARFSVAALAQEIGYRDLEQAGATEKDNKVPPPEVIERLVSASRESVAPVGIGGVVLHHSHTLHTSHVNRSRRWRRGYATHWAAADVTSQSGFVEGAYFNRPGYPDLDA